jgi:hypothetical protein
MDDPCLLETPKCTVKGDAVHLPKDIFNLLLPDGLGPRKEHTQHLVTHRSDA